MYIFLRQALVCVSGSKVLSSYGEKFFTSLEKLVHDHQVKRDREAGHCEDIRLEQERLDQELRDILDEQENRLQDSLLKSAVTDDSTCEDASTKTDLKDEVCVKSKADLDNIGNDKAKTTGSHRKHRKDIKSPDGDSKLDIKSGRKTKRDESLRKKRPEWNNDFTGELTNLSLDDPEEARGNKMENQESAARFKGEGTYMLNPDLNISVEESKSEHVESKSAEELSTKPPRTKKKLGYTPNTFVPNRTLQLRRSGSLNKLSDNKPGDKVLTGGSKDEHPTDVEVVRDNSGKTGHVRSQSKDRAGDKLPSKRPAFR